MSDKSYNNLINRQSQLYAKNNQFLFHTHLHFWSVGALILYGILALKLPLRLLVMIQTLPSFFLMLTIWLTCWQAKRQRRAGYASQSQANCYMA
jgi:hypothetical protein